MFIPFLVILTPLTLAPLWLSHLYRLEINWSENQIDVDNLAIRLGREDRKTFNKAQQKSFQIKTVHKIYHKALACTAIPATALQCLSLSRKLLSTIQLLKLGLENFLHTSWQLNRLKASQWIVGIGKGVHLDRAYHLSVSWKPCPICQSPLTWSVPNTQLHSRLILASDSRIRVSVSLLLEKASKWEYRLWAQ